EFRRVLFRSGQIVDHGLNDFNPKRPSSCGKRRRKDWKIARSRMEYERPQWCRSRVQYVAKNRRYADFRPVLLSCDGLKRRCSRQNAMSALGQERTSRLTE